MDNILDTLETSLFTDQYIYKNITLKGLANMFIHAPVRDKHVWDLTKHRTISVPGLKVRLQLEEYQQEASQRRILDEEWFWTVSCREIYPDTRSRCLLVHSCPTA